MSRPGSGQLELVLDHVGGAHHRRHRGELVTRGECSDETVAVEARGDTEPLARVEAEAALLDAARDQEAPREAPLGSGVRPALLAQDALVDVDRVELARLQRAPAPHEREGSHVDLGPPLDARVGRGLGALLLVVAPVEPALAEEAEAATHGHEALDAAAHDDRRVGQRVRGIEVDVAVAPGVSQLEPGLEAQGPDAEAGLGRVGLVVLRVGASRRESEAGQGHGEGRGAGASARSHL